MQDPKPHKTKRLKVLVIAEAANPEWVSVPLVGWSLAHALRNVADVHIVTQVRNKEAIERFGWREGEEFTAIDTEHLAKPVWKIASALRMGKGKGWTVVTAFQAAMYPYFERMVWRKFGADIQAGEYDVVHRVTPLTPTTVSPLASRCAKAGVPFVIGPLNGGVPWPKGFDYERRREKEWLSYVRGAYKLMPGRGKMLRNTRAIIAGSHYTAGEVPSKYQSKIVYIPENAIDLERFNRRATQDVSDTLRGCFIGRLVPYKGPDILLEAAASVLREGRFVLDIIGDGPMREDLEALAEQLGIAQSVTFHGNLPHQRVQDIAVQSNLLTFPSVREFGGGVVLEAMSLGVVPLIVDYAGPGELVDAETGFKVPIGSRAEIVASFEQKLRSIVDDPSDLPRIGQNAWDAVQSNFTWPAKANQVRQVYEWVCGIQSTKPTFFSNSPFQEPK